jgi:Uma2 family endonuclease
MGAPRIIRHLRRMEARMSGATSPPEWTYAEYARLPDDGNRYEVLDGEVLVTPSPGTRHQRIAARLWRALDVYVREYGLGEVLWDLDLLFVTGQFLRPDMIFVPNAERRRLTERGMEGVPGLIVEVVSPSSVRIDRVQKPARYADFGVPEYWVVDPDRRAILIWDFERGAAEPRVETGMALWQPEPGTPPLGIDVPALFEAS